MAEVKWKDGGKAGAASPTEKEARVVKEPANVVTRNVRLVREAALIISYPKLDFPPVPRATILPFLVLPSPRSQLPGLIQAFRPVMRRELRVARRSLKTDARTCAGVTGWGRSSWNKFVERIGYGSKRELR